jgi:hypothetical protein
MITQQVPEIIQLGEGIFSFRVITITTLPEKPTAHPDNKRVCCFLLKDF